MAAALTETRATTGAMQGDGRYLAAAARQQRAHRLEAAAPAAALRLRSAHRVISSSSAAMVTAAGRRNQLSISLPWGP